jgi:hypothetical protein
MRCFFSSSLFMPLLSTFALACGSGDEEVISEGTWRGIVTVAFETQAFEECGARAPWWMNYDTIGSEIQALCSTSPDKASPPCRLSAVAAGALRCNRRPGYGHLGRYTCELGVTEFSSVFQDPEAACSLQ